MTNSQTAVSFCGSCSGESNHCGALLKVDDQLVDGNMVHISSTKFYYFWSRVSSWMSQWALALQELRLLLVTLSFNSEDKPKAITLTAFLGTSGSTCACKSLCPPLLELPSCNLRVSSCNTSNADNFLSLLWGHHMQRICRCRACVHTALWGLQPFDMSWGQEDCLDPPITRYEGG